LTNIEDQGQFSVPSGEDKKGDKFIIPFDDGVINERNLSNLISIVRDVMEKERKKIILENSDGSQGFDYVDYEVDFTLKNPVDLNDQNEMEKLLSPVPVGSRNNAQITIEKYPPKDNPEPLIIDNETEDSKKDVSKGGRNSFTLKRKKGYKKEKKRRFAKHKHSFKLNKPKKIIETSVK
jgi:hypothetical protein